MRNYNQNNSHQNQLSEQAKKKIYHWIDMDYIVTDWQFAKIHGKSTKVGFNVHHHKKNKFQEENKDIIQQLSDNRCICCLNYIDKKPIPLCYNTKNLKFLGPGFPLFYTFLRSVITLLLILIASYSVLELFWAISHNHNFCVNNNPRIVGQHHVKCTSYMILFSSISQQVKAQEKVLRISSFCITLIFLIIIRDNFKKIISYYDEQDTNYEDFSILMQNLPTKEQIKNDLKIQKSIGQILRSFFKQKNIFSTNKLSQNGDFEIKKILLIAKHQKIQHQIQHRKKKIYQLINKNKSANNEQKKNRNVIQNKQIEQINLEIRKYLSQIKKQLDTQNINSDKAIISFQRQDQRVQVQREFQNASVEQLRKYFGENGNKVIMGRAPIPHEIIWENMDISRSEQLKYKIVSWIIFIIALGVFTTAFYFIKSTESHLIESLLSHQKGQISDHNVQHKAKALFYCSIILIIIFNKFILAEIIHHLVQFERHKTASSLEFSFCLKYTLGLFFTTALMTLLVQGVTTNNIYKEDYGVVEEQTIMYFFNSFIVPAIWLINPWHIAKWIKRKIYYGTFNMTQGEANKLMENPEYIIGKRYGEVLENVWFTYLYVCIIPAGSVLIFVGMGLFYWIDKYNLLRRSSVSENLGGKLVLEALNLLDLVLIFKPAGELIFDNWLRKQWTVISVIEICIAFVYIILPKNLILQKIYPQPFNLASKTYDQLSKDKNVLKYEYYYTLTRIQQIGEDYHHIQLASVHNEDKKKDINRSRIIRPLSFIEQNKVHEDILGTEDLIMVRQASQRGNQNEFDTL